MRNIINFFKDDWKTVLQSVLMAAGAATIGIIVIVSLFSLIGCDDQELLPGTTLEMHLVQLECNYTISEQAPDNPWDVDDNEPFECLYTGAGTINCETREVSIWKMAGEPYIDLDTLITIYIPESQPSDEWFYAQIDGYNIMIHATQY